jgi:hypothetical protein
MISGSSFGVNSDRASGCEKIICSIRDKIQFSSILNKVARALADGEAELSLISKASSPFGLPAPCVCPPGPPGREFLGPMGPGLVGPYGAFSRSDNLGFGAVSSPNRLQEGLEKAPGV